MADGCGHASDLAISTFVYGELEPAIRYRFACAHGGMSWPQIRGVDKLDLGRTGGAILESDALAQFLQITGLRLAFHLNQIGFGQVKARLADTCLQGAVIGK